MISWCNVKDTGTPKIAGEVAKSLIVQGEAIGWNKQTASIDRLFAEATCSALIERYYFAKARQPLIVEGRFANYKQITSWQSQIEEVFRPQLAKIAAKLADNPEKKGLRAPPRLVKKEPTKNLLSENLLDGQTSRRSHTGRR